MWRNTLMKKTNKPHIGTTAATTRGHTDSTTPLLFVTYFCTKKIKNKKKREESHRQA